MAVADDLHLDVARIVDILLDQHAVVAERRLGLALGADDRRREFRRRPHDPHAASAAARGCLDQNRKPDLVGGISQRLVVLRLAMKTGHQRHTGLLHQHLGAGFGTHRRHHRSRGADEHQFRVRTGLRELGILRQKSVAGMHGLGAALLRGVDDALDVEITVARPRRAEQHRLVGHRHMQRIAIGLGINRDGAQAHRFCSTDHAASDLAAIGDQQCAKTSIQCRRHHHILNRPKRVGSIGALADAERPKPSTSLVSAGSITPSSHIRAVA